MFLILIKIVLMASFGCILYQDIKDRAVYWFLFPVVGICIGVLYFFNTLPELFLISVLTNLVFIVMLFTVIYLYTKLKLKTKVNQVIGLGDLLLLMALIFSCATISFMVLLSSALVFSLVLHLCLSKFQKTVTVPLAGYISLFFGIVFMGVWSGLINSLYII